MPTQRVLRIRPRNQSIPESSARSNHDNMVNLSYDEDDP